MCFLTPLLPPQFLVVLCCFENAVALDSKPCGVRFYPLFWKHISQNIWCLVGLLELDCKMFGFQMNVNVQTMNTVTQKSLRNFGPVWKGFVNSDESVRVCDAGTALQEWQYLSISDHYFHLSEFSVKIAIWKKIRDLFHGSKMLQAKLSLFP